MNIKLNETPHIKINEKTGQIDYTSAHISSAWNNENIKGTAISYNTVIGVYINGYYLETAGVYSQTTCSKHKPRAASIALYNNYIIVDEIKPAALLNIINAPADQQPEILEKILQESQDRKQLLKELHNNEYTGTTLKDLQYKGVIKARKPPETTNYKNGNYLTKYYCKANFKYCSPIYYETNVKHIKKTLKPYYGRNGYKPAAATNTIQYNIVNIEA